MNPRETQGSLEYLHVPREPLTRRTQSCATSASRWFDTSEKSYWRFFFPSQDNAPRKYKFPAQLFLGPPYLPQANQILPFFFHGFPFFNPWKQVPPLSTPLLAANRSSSNRSSAQAPNSCSCRSGRRATDGAADGAAVLSFSIYVAAQIHHPCFSVSSSHSLSFASSL